MRASPCSRALNDIQREDDMPEDMKSHWTLREDGSWTQDPLPPAEPGFGFLAGDGEALAGAVLLPVDPEMGKLRVWALLPQYAGRELPRGQLTPEQARGALSLALEHWKKVGRPGASPPDHDPHLRPWSRKWELDYRETWTGHRALQVRLRVRDGNTVWAWTCSPVPGRGCFDAGDAQRLKEAQAQADASYRDWSRLQGQGDPRAYRIPPLALVPGRWRLWSPHLNREAWVALGEQGKARYPAMSARTLDTADGWEWEWAVQVPVPSTGGAAWLRDRGRAGCVYAAQLAAEARYLELVMDLEEGERR